MKIILSPRRHHYVTRVSAFLIVAAIIAGTVACGGGGLVEYDLTIASTAGGSVTTPGEDTYTYDEGEVVNLVGEPDEGYRFKNWTGDVESIDDVNAASTTIIMNGNHEITATFEQTPTITFAVAGPMTESQGEQQWWGAELARDEINAAAGVSVGGVSHQLELVQVDTNEISGTPEEGLAALQTVIDDVDFVLGGYWTDKVVVYREEVMDAKKIFMDCGAASGALQYSTVEDYDRYKYWFKTSPHNGVFVTRAWLKMTGTVGIVLRQMLEGYGDAVAEDYRVPEDGKLRVHILGDYDYASYWEKVVSAAQTYLPLAGFTVTGTTLVSATASNITSELLAIAAAKPHIIFTAFAGPVSDVYSTQKADLGIPAMTIGVNVVGGWKAHWANTDGKCNGEIQLDTFAEGLENTTETTGFFDAFVAKTGTYPYYPAGTYNAIYQLKEAIEAVSLAHAWDAIAEVLDPASIDALVQYLETSSYTVAAGKIAYYPMPAVTINATPPGLYALSEAQVLSLYDLPSYGKTYVQSDWRCGYVDITQQYPEPEPHIAHDLVYGPGYLTGIGSQWQDGHKVGVWPMDFGDAYDEAFTDQYGCWNFEYPGTVDVMIPIEGFLA
jgi:branched-chain amino acid transport system substrate-binding protein